MMMTSTFPTSKSNSRNIKHGLKEIQSRKECLITLQVALQKRINEFRELCLKEGELTGHLPADYPLQPREPIPQVRRRITRSSGNLPHELLAANIIMPPPSSHQRMLSDLTNGVAKFQPYYEETKPFQMSDFYKYSSKHRLRSTSSETGEPVTNNNHFKTTRQLQQEVASARSSFKFSHCDDQIQQSMRLIERSGQKVMEATAHAIAGNPSLAERLKNIQFLTNHTNN